MGTGRRWGVQFTDHSTSTSSRDVADPRGFSRASSKAQDDWASSSQKDAGDDWKVTKAWEVALSPFRNLMMTGIMMWIAGNTGGLGLPIRMTTTGIIFSALWQPISALQNVGKIFEPFKDNKVDLLMPKLVFIALNLMRIALGIWKLNSLGFLPTNASYWVSSLPTPQEVEYSAG